MFEHPNPMRLALNTSVQIMFFKSVDV